MQQLEASSSFTFDILWQKKARVGNPFYSSRLPLELPLWKRASQTALMVVIAACLLEVLPVVLKGHYFLFPWEFTYLGLFISSPVPPEAVNDNNCQTLFCVFLCASSFAWSCAILQQPFEVVPILKMRRLMHEGFCPLVELRHEPKHLKLNAQAVYKWAKLSGPLYTLSHSFGFCWLSLWFIHGRTRLAKNEVHER